MVSEQPIPVAPDGAIDWREIARVVLDGVLSGVHRWLETERARIEAQSQDASNDIADDLDEQAEAAALLGVDLDANPDELRAALRAKIAASRLHPHHGGHGAQPTRLHAAKNL